MAPRPKQQQQPEQPSRVVTRGALRRARQAAAASPRSSAAGSEPDTAAAYWPPAPYGYHGWTAPAPRTVQAAGGVPGGASTGRALPHPPACGEQRAAFMGPGPRAESKAKAQQQQPGLPIGCGGAKEPPGGTEPGAKRGRKHRSWASETSWDEEPEVSRGTRFWMEGAFIPPLPSWMLRRRAKTQKYLSKRPGPKEPPVIRGGDRSDLPGAHLPRKLRERALDGYFVDVFDMARPLEDTAGTEPCGERQGKEPGGTERTFLNWLRGYAEYAALISGAYPERGWHLARHLSHVLEARELAGESAAMAYDYSFRMRASHCPRARWDRKHGESWLLMVGPYIRPKRSSDSDVPASEGEDRQVCWDFNDGNCARRHCKFEHVCESCFGPHSKVACV